MKLFQFIVEHSPFAYGSPCWPLLVEGFNEVTQDGFAVPNMILTARDEALYIRGPDGDIVAALAFGMIGSPRSINVKLVFVEPSSRRLGYFNALWQELTVRARNADCNSLCIEAHSEDATAIAILRGKTHSQAQALRFSCAIRQ